MKIDTTVPPANIGDTQIGINGIALLSPLTGIGQYTFHLTIELQQLLARKPWLFYATGWSQDIRNQPMPHIASLKDLIRRFIPNSYQIARVIQQHHFSEGARNNGIQLYHEPNFLAFRYRGPTVVTVHDLSWIRHPEMHPVERVRNMDRLMPEVVRRADHILADSEFVRQEIIGHYGVPPDRVSAVLLGTQPAFHPADERACQAVLAAHGLRYGEYLLAVGTLEPRKNLLTALNAYAQLPDAIRRRYPLVVAGSSGWRMEGFAPSLQRMIQRGEVIQTGYVAQADLPLLYAGARMLVFPSVYEGFGLPPLEAMASGIPVITSNRASLPEVVGDAGILVEPMDDQTISAHMLALIDDNNLHQRLSVAGIARARNFTWRRCALHTLSIYRKVLDAI